MARWRREPFSMHYDDFVLCREDGKELVSCVGRLRESAENYGVYMYLSDTSVIKFSWNISADEMIADLSTYMVELGYDIDPVMDEI